MGLVRTANRSAAPATYAGETAAEAGLDPESTERHAQAQPSLKGASVRRKTSIACLSAATVIVTITGCGAQTHSDGSHALAKDGTFTTVIQEDPGNLHPLVTSLLSAQLVDSYAYDSLLFFDPTSGRAQPYLAKSWTDGAKRVSFVLHPDITCADGRHKVHRQNGCRQHQLDRR